MVENFEVQTRKAFFRVWMALFWQELMPTRRSGNDILHHPERMCENEHQSILFIHLLKAYRKEQEKDF